MGETSEWVPPKGWVRLSDRRWSHWLMELEPSTVASIIVTSVEPLPILGGTPVPERLRRID